MFDQDMLLYDLKAAAEAVSMSVDTLRREYRRGALVMRGRGGKLYVTREELQRWIEDEVPVSPPSVYGRSNSD